MKVVLAMNVIIGVKVILGIVLTIVIAIINVDFIIRAAVISSTYVGIKRGIQGRTRKILPILSVGQEGRWC